MRSLYVYGFLVGAHIGGVDRASDLPALIEPQMFIASSLFLAPLFIRYLCLVPEERRKWQRCSFLFSSHTATQDHTSQAIIVRFNTFVVKNIIETQTYTGATAAKATMVARMHK